MERVKQLDFGIAMFVSDLQGNIEDYRQVLQIYEVLKEASKVDYLIFGGDLIHGYAGYKDHSLEMLEDLRSRQSRDPNLIHLMGNHELSHVMHWELSKDNKNFTREFETAMGERRQELVNHLQNLPFAVLSSGGILFNHSGPSAALGGQKDPRWDLFLSMWPARSFYMELDFLKEFLLTPVDHRQFSQELGKRTLAMPAGHVLWEVFMNKNEHSYGEQYQKILNGFLINFQNEDGQSPLLVSAHIEEPEGFRVVTPSHLRVCTSYGAKSDAAKKFLLVDLASTYPSAESLLPQLRKLWF